jgi:hypothetical protein
MILFVSSLKIGRIQCNFTSLPTAINYRPTLTKGAKKRGKRPGFPPGERRLFATKEPRVVFLFLLFSHNAPCSDSGSVGLSDSHMQTGLSYQLSILERTTNIEYVLVNNYQECWNLIAEQPANKFVLPRNAQRVI